MDVLSNEAMVERIRAGIDARGYLGKLYQRNRPLIYKTVKPYCKMVEVEDLMQEAYFGLMRAVDQWQPERGAFTTCLSVCVRSVVRRYVADTRSAIRIPEGERWLLYQMERTESDYLREYGKKPSTRTLSRLLGVSKEKVASLRKTAEMATISSTDAIIAGTEGVTVGESVPDQVNHHEKVLEEVEHSQLHCALWSVVDSLPGYDSDVIRMVWQEGLTTTEVADKLGCTPKRARNMLHKAMRDLQHPTRSYSLRPYLYDDDTHSRGMQGVGVGPYLRTWTSATERAALGKALLED